MLTLPDIRVGGSRITFAPHNCFACGTLNAHGLQLELHAGDGVCWTELTLDRRFEGWEGIAHGGIVCTLLDEVMAWALVDHDLWGVTAKMSVEFKRTVPIGRPIRAEGRVAGVRRNGRRRGRRHRARDRPCPREGRPATYFGAPANRKRT